MPLIGVKKLMSVIENLELVGLKLERAGSLVSLVVLCRSPNRFGDLLKIAIDNPSITIVEDNEEDLA